MIITLRSHSINSRIQINLKKIKIFTPKSLHGYLRISIINGGKTNIDVYVGEKRL